MAYDAFDSSDLDIASNPKPIWTIALDDPKEEKNILKWLNTELQHLKRNSEDRLKSIRQNLSIYKGIQYYTQEPRSSSTREHFDNSPKASRRIGINHMYDLTEAKVSRLIKYRPAVEIMPTNDEFSDKIAAKQTKYLLDHLWYIQNFDGYVANATRLSRIAGEAYLFIEWNPDIGDLHPQSPKDGEKVPLVDESGKPKVDDNGTPMFIEQELHVGDVEYKLVFPGDVFVERARSFEDAKYLYKKEVKNTEELRQEYPEKATEIKPDQDEGNFDYEKLEERKLQNETCVHHFYHKRCKIMPKGRYIIFTKSAVLLNVELPYSMDNEFPCERLPDIVIPQEVHAASFYSQTKHIARAYDNLTSLILRNQTFVSHPKWMVPAGSAKIESLGNQISVVQYKGSVPPVLAQCAPTPKEIFDFREQLKEELQQISGIYGTSRGEPPPGIDAFVALQFMNEQELERQNAQVQTFNEFIRKTAVKTLSVCGDYYDSSDERMIRIIGKNNAWMSSYFDAANLSKDYDIRIQNSSALPQSKAARVQVLTTLKEKFPALIGDEQFLDMLDFGQSEKFFGIASNAVSAAEAENEDMATSYQKKDAGGKVHVEEPTEYEDLLTHWKVHAQYVQQRSFKTMTPPEVQAAFKDHILATEYLMYSKAKANPTFGQMLTTVPLWPLYFKLPSPVAPVAPPSQGMDDTASLAASPPAEALPQMGPEGEPVMQVRSELSAPPPPPAELPGTPENPGPVQQTSAQ